MNKAASTRQKGHSVGEVILGFFRLIRFPNLLFIFVTQFLLQYAVVYAIFQQFLLSTSLSNMNFFFLSCSTILIAAGGNLINDYYDLKMDQINKPEKIILGRLISKKTGIIFYILFNLTGIILGFWVAAQVGYILLGIVPLACAILLWMYSYRWKRQALIGNIIVSLLTAISIWIIGFYEPQLYLMMKGPDQSVFQLVKSLILLYGGFAFFISMIRELVKDLEDVEGDKQADCRTLPIVKGATVAKKVTYLMAALLIILLAFAQFHAIKMKWFVPVGYFLLGIQLPLIWLCTRLHQAQEKREYHQLSSLAKWMMIIGVISMLFFVKM